MSVVDVLVAVCIALVVVPLFGVMGLYFLLQLAYERLDERERP